MKQDLQDAMAAKSDLEEQAQHMQTRSVELETSREALRSELQILKEQLRKQGADHKGVVDTMVTRFNELRAMFQAKEEEFNTLMDVKITLAMEIKAYRALLEKEEVRLGYLGSGNVGPRQVDKTEKLLVVAFDLDGTYLRMKNGATENISLNGWKLTSVKTLKEFSFPDTSIKPGESFTLFFGKDANKNSKKHEGISFAVGDIFDSSSDSGFIVDNLGRMVNKVGFLTVPQ
jgi:seryl-tRNA synthetase